MAFEDYTTVEEVLDGQAVLVGEQHERPGRARSKRLAERVLDEYKPEVVAVESGTRRTFYDGAMGALWQYADETDTLHVGIDNRDKWDDLDVYLPHFHQRINVFTHPIEEDGDLDEQAVTDARARVAKEFDDDAFDAVFTDRESGMAGRIMHLVEHYDTPLVVGMGAFHVKAVARKLDDGVEPIDIGKARMRNL